MKKTLTLALILVMGASFVSAATAGKDKKKKQAAAAVLPQPVVLDSHADSLSYAAGLAMTDGLDLWLKRNYELTESQLDKVLAGFDSAVGQERLDSLKAVAAGVLLADLFSQHIQKGVLAEMPTLDENLFLSGFRAGLTADTTHFHPVVAKTFYRKGRADALAAAGREFLENNKKQPGVRLTDSGLQLKVLTEGHGAVAQNNDTVVVNYEGRLIDGTVFDSSYQRNQPASFCPSQVIKGWTEALTMMPEGSKWELYIPQELAYGERQAGSIPPYSTLIFTVEVLQVKKAGKTLTAVPMAEKVEGKVKKTARK